MQDKSIIKSMIQSMIQGMLGAGASGPMVYDTFTGTGALASHTPDIDVVGGGWSQIQGAFTLDGDEVYTQTATAEALITLPTADFAAEMIFLEVAAVPTAGIVLRRQDASNYWWVFSSGGKWFLRDVVAGVATNRAATSVVSALLGVAGLQLTVTANGQSIDIHYVGGSDSVTASYGLATNFASVANAGILDLGSANRRYIDTFTVTTP